MINERKCAIVGCGFVGATIAYTLLQSGMFSEMVLIDINKNKARGEAEDLSHCLPFHAPMDIYAGDYKDASDCAIVIIAAGANQRPGQSRLSLVETNVAIMNSIVSHLLAVGSEAILLVVSNPVDIVTYAALARSGFPKSRVIGSGTVLDSARLKYLAGKHFAVDPRNVHSFIIGEHGDSELAVFSSANISGIDLGDFCSTGHTEIQTGACAPSAMQKLYEEVKGSAYRIIEGKDATYYGIAEATRRIVGAIVNDEKSIMPVSAYLDGEYGIRDVSIGVPCVVGKDGIENVLEIPLDDGELAALRRSASELQGVLHAISVPSPFLSKR